MNIKPFVTPILFAALLGSCKSNQNDATTQNQRRGGQQGPPSIDQLFEMDQNGDGFLAKDELKGRILNDFDKIDINGDGLLSREEMENAPKPQRGQRPQRS